jgi:hypothetical protein
MRPYMELGDQSLRCTGVKVVACGALSVLAKSCFFTFAGSRPEETMFRAQRDLLRMYRRKSRAISATLLDKETNSTPLAE